MSDQFSKLHIGTFIRVRQIRIDPLRLLCDFLFAGQLPAIAKTKPSRKFLAIFESDSK